MGIETIAAALELEHREIDDGIAQFAGSPGSHQDSLAHAILLLRRHIYLEEEFLFPLLREAEAGIAAPVLVMLREHGQIWDTLDCLESELEGDDIELAHCRQLTSQLLHHNLKEEKVIYPRADVLAEPTASQLREFIASRQLPDGWVCAKAATARRWGSDGLQPDTRRSATPPTAIGLAEGFLPGARSATRPKTGCSRAEP